MFDPLRDPLIFELEAREHQDAARRHAAYDRLSRGLRRLGGRPGPRERLARWTGALLVRLGYRLIPLPDPVPLPDSVRPDGPPPAAERGHSRPPAAPRAGRRDCRRPAPRLPHGLSLAGD
jgi:hypothetical protein